MAVNSLGIFDFIKLEVDGQRGGAPPIPQMQLVPMQRPGTDGTIFTETGIKGEMFTVRTVRDVANIAVGNALGVYYQLADRSSAWVLVFQGIDYSATYNVRYVVQRVNQISVVRLTGSKGGVMGGGAGALVTATWTLMPVAYEAP